MKYMIQFLKTGKLPNIYEAMMKTNEKNCSNKYKPRNIFNPGVEKAVFGLIN